MPMWRFEPVVRVNTRSRGQVAESRECLDCGGHTNRLAEREAKHPYPWIPIGYRCDRCGNCYIDTQVTV